MDNSINVAVIMFYIMSYSEGEKNIGAPKMRNDFFSDIAIAILNFSLLYPIQLSLTLRWQKVSLLISLLYILYRFCTILASFLYCSPYSYRSIAKALSHPNRRQRKVKYNLWNLKERKRDNYKQTQYKKKVKAKNQHKIFEKHLKQKREREITINKHNIRKKKSKEIIPKMKQKLS